MGQVVSCQGHFGSGRGEGKSVFSLCDMVLNQIEPYDVLKCSSHVAMGNLGPTH